MQVEHTPGVAASGGRGSSKTDATKPTQHASRPNAGARIAEARAELIRSLEALAREVDQVRADEGFRQLLVGFARLSDYSMLNRVRILGTCPGATAVLGRRDWERLGRRVREGAAPIEIAAPSRPGRGGWPFVVVEVFDITQTDGAPVPAIDAPRGETGSLGIIEAAAPRLGLRIETVEDLGAATHGGRVIGEALGGRVRLVGNLTALERAATLVHEYAHELLHDPGTGRCGLPTSVRETEAQAVAFVVLQALAVPCTAPGYIAWQGGSGKTILASLRRIDAAARRILRAIDPGRSRRSGSGST